MNALEQCDLFFVYGTLKKGYWNNRFLGDSVCLGEAITVGNYKMEGMGVPYLTKGGRLTALGELYRVTDTDVLSRLDRLEGHPDSYCREIIAVQDRQDVVTQAWCYLYPNDSEYPFATENETYGLTQEF